MAGSVSNDLRDAMMAAFRARVCSKMGAVPFRHQADWWLAGDGLVLTEEIDESQGYQIQLVDGTLARYRTAPRNGGRARVIADLGAFKVGKSFSAGLWGTGFAAIPGAKVSLVGLEYDICAPEFDYICEALLSERGMGLKYTSMNNRPRSGSMYIEFPNGCKYEAKSWERKDTLKGKEVDAYIFCEAFMLPGIECYSGVKQNLAARSGFAVFPTTPDRPWVEEFHLRGHGDCPGYEDWHCVCSVPRSVNRFTFSQLDMDQAKGIMTGEKFAIAYEGKLGDYVGRVYNYQRGQNQFNPTTHPFLFRDGVCDLAHIQLPEGWKVEGASDTGAYMSGVVAAVSPDGEAFILSESPNYHYKSHELELDESTSIPGWALEFGLILNRFGVHSVWADKNSQFKHELLNYDIHLLGNSIKLEARTEISRSYFQHKRIWLAPWLQILPFEIENAEWPPEATQSGKFERIKRNDHTLDCMEHILSKHPRGQGINRYRPLTFAEEAFGQFKQKGNGNNHLGAA